MKHLFLFILFISVFTAAGAQKKYVPAEEPKQEFPYISGVFSHQNGILFNLEDDANSHTISGYHNTLDWLQGRVAGLQVYTLGNGSRIAVIRNRMASVYVDEIPSDFSYLNGLPVWDIAAILVIKQPMGLSAPGGVIAIYTKRGADEEPE